MRGQCRAWHRVPQQLHACHRAFLPLLQRPNSSLTRPFFKVKRERHQRVALQLDLLAQAANFRFVRQQPPRAARVFVEDVALLIGADVDALGDQLAVIDVCPGILQVDPSARRLLTSVPTSSMPVSSASMTKYSWRASRLTAIIFLHSLSSAMEHTSFAIVVGY